MTASRQFGTSGSGLVYSVLYMLILSARLSASYLDLTGDILTKTVTYGGSSTHPTIT